MPFLQKSFPRISHVSADNRGLPSAFVRVIRGGSAPCLRLVASILFSLLAGAAGAGEPPVTAAAAVAADSALALPAAILADPAHDPAWLDLFAQLRPEKTRQSRFEERRYFPFREKPVILTGEIRLAPERGLSLSYAGPKPHVMIVDRQGVLLRDERGRQRAAPADDRAQTATSALFHILRFDLPALEREFVLHGARDGAAWTLGFVARDPALARLVGTVIVHGRAGRLDRIEMAKSDRQRIEILIGDTQENIAFSADVLKRFFR